jgi:hypothetical protein
MASRDLAGNVMEMLLKNHIKINYILNFKADEIDFSDFSLDSIKNKYKVISKHRN